MDPILRHASRPGPGRTNFAAVYAPLPGNLTVSQNLRVFGLIYGVRHLPRASTHCSQQFDLAASATPSAACCPPASRPASPCQGHAQPPALLLLDEPTASLDPATAGTSAATIRAFVAAGDVRRAVDLAQHVRGRGGVRPGAVHLRAASCCSRATRRRCPASTARTRSRSCSSPWRASRCRSAMTMQPRRALAIVLRQVYLIRGSPARVLPLFAWVAIDIVLWGFITRYLNTVASAGIQLRPRLLGAVLLWDFFTRRHAGRDHRLPRGRLVAQLPQPLRVAALDPRVPGRASCSQHRHQHGRPGRDARAGHLRVRVVVPRARRRARAVPAGPVPLRHRAGHLRERAGAAAGAAAEWFVWPIPAWCRPVRRASSIRRPHCRHGCRRSRGLPPSYVFEGMRGIVLGRRASALPLAIGAALAVVYLSGACLLVARVYRHAVRTGLIARYSAESVSQVWRERQSER